MITKIYLLRIISFRLESMIERQLHNVQGSQADFHLKSLDH